MYLVKMDLRRSIQEFTNSCEGSHHFTAPLKQQTQMSEKLTNLRECKTIALSASSTRAELYGILFYNADQDKVLPTLGDALIAALFFFKCKIETIL